MPRAMSSCARWLLRCRAVCVQRRCPARIGGDRVRFVAHVLQPQRAVAVAEKMVQVVRSPPVVIDGQVFQVGASAGARFQRPGRWGRCC